MILKGLLASALAIAASVAAMEGAYAAQPAPASPQPAPASPQPAPASPQQTVAAALEKDAVAVTVDGKPFTSYKFAATQKYPYLWPVNGPVSGQSITTESSEPYPHHHSLFFGCDRVNGGNYWQEGNDRGQILSQGPKIVEAAPPSGERVVFTDECLWRQPNQDPVIRDTRLITISAPTEKTRIIDFEITLEPLTDVRIEKTNHSLFSARLVHELSVEAGGTLVNAQGDTAEKGTFGVASPWCDYSGTRGGVAASAPPQTEGLAILQHPANRWYPARWFTRDYGFFSPTPMYWLADDPCVPADDPCVPADDRLDLPKGEAFTLRYRVVVHAGDAKAAQIADAYKQYQESAKPQP